MSARILAVCACASCWRGEPPASAPAQAMVCAVDLRAGARVVLDCTATNLGTTADEVCAQPYLAVRETGALYSSHAPVCSSELEPRAHEHLVVHLDVARDLCRPERGGCGAHALALRADGTPDFASVIGLARSLEATARAPGRDRPSLAQCDALLATWSRDPAFASYGPFLRADLDEVRVFCIGLSVAAFECLRMSRSSEQVDACSPTKRVLSE